MDIGAPGYSAAEEDMWKKKYRQASTGLFVIVFEGTVAVAGYTDRRRRITRMRRWSATASGPRRSEK